MLMSEGLEVKIFTARVTCDPDGNIARRIQDWLEENDMPRLAVTNVKDYGMLELYDDRAVQIEFNTGQLLGHSTRRYRRLYPNKETIQ